ncbi:MAG: hypothetical protein KC620_10825, partial [Myxococcales bacterium]|nr:hypothetical protein [Myxococcales bacterium]
PPEQDECAVYWTHVVAVFECAGGVIDDVDGGACVITGGAAACFTTTDCDAESAINRLGDMRLPSCNGGLLRLFVGVLRGVNTLASLQCAVDAVARLDWCEGDAEARAATGCMNYTLTIERTR